MALYLRDQGKRSELQEKIAAELREKIASQSKMEDKSDLPDGVEDSAYIKTYQKKEGPSNRVVILLGALFVTLIIVALVILLAK